MSSALDPQFKSPALENYAPPEQSVSFLENKQAYPEKAKDSLEEEASRAIADATDDLPANQEGIIAAAPKNLAAAENFSSLEIENRNQRLEAIFQNIEELLKDKPEDKKAFYNLVYQSAQMLRRRGDFYSLDALHDGAIERASKRKKPLN